MSDAPFDGNPIADTVARTCAALGWSETDIFPLACVLRWTRVVVDLQVTATGATWATGEGKLLGWTRGDNLYPRGEASAPSRIPGARR